VIANFNESSSIDRDYLKLTAEPAALDCRESVTNQQLLDNPDTRTHFIHSHLKFTLLAREFLHRNLHKKSKMSLRCRGKPSSRAGYPSSSLVLDGVAVDWRNGTPRKKQPPGARGVLNSASHRPSRMVNKKNDDRSFE